MFFIVSKAISFLFRPIVWIFLFLFFALIKKEKRKKFLILAITSLYFFSNGFIVDEVSRIWEVPRTTINQVYDVGIILGGLADYDTITKTPNFNNRADRLLDAERLYYQGKIKKIMICGGNSDAFSNGYVEADAMKKYLLVKKIPEKDIIAENRSRNTKENAFNAAKILNNTYPNGDFLLITSAVHMRRSQLCFEKAKIKVTPFPTDCTKAYRSTGWEYMFIPRIEALEQWQRLIHEWIGYIVYKIAF